MSSLPVDVDIDVNVVKVAEEQPAATSAGLFDDRFPAIARAHANLKARLSISSQQQQSRSPNNVSGEHGASVAICESDSVGGVTKEGICGVVKSGCSSVGQLGPRINGDTVRATTNDGSVSVGGSPVVAQVRHAMDSCSLNTSTERRHVSEGNLALNIGSAIQHQFNVVKSDCSTDDARACARTSTHAKGLCSFRQQDQHVEGMSKEGYTYEVSPDRTEEKFSEGGEEEDDAVDENLCCNSAVEYDHPISFIEGGLASRVKQQVKDLAANLAWRQDTARCIESALSV
jgi:hypothetical protein